MAARLPLITIVGPTAGGKTLLAIELAKKFNGEIICADSRTIYRGMDIGTAKPTNDEQKNVPHWGLDLVDPGERFTAADFKQYAQQKIVEIRGRGHIPFLVGGTGLYVNGVLYNYHFRNGYNEIFRQHLEKMTNEELIIYSNKHNVVLPKNIKNKRHLVRAIETKNVPKSVNTTLAEDAIVVGITLNSNEERDVKITNRAHQMFHKGVVDEAISLAEQYGWNSEAMTGNIYPLIRMYLDHKLSFDELLERFIIADRQLAKRQMTWFKRDRNIKWLSASDARRYLTYVLSEH
jgi:tRNA dimethylallyltransferase